MNMRVARAGVESRFEKDDRVVVEGPLEYMPEHPLLCLEPIFFGTTMRTPGDDENLAIGLLYGEGIVNQPSDIDAIESSTRLRPEVRSELRRHVDFLRAVVPLEHPQLVLLVTEFGNLGAGPYWNPGAKSIGRWAARHGLFDALDILALRVLDPRRIGSQHRLNAVAVFLDHEWRTVSLHELPTDLHVTSVVRLAIPDGEGLHNLTSPVIKQVDGLERLATFNEDDAVAIDLAAGVVLVH
jgi:hypothetical protein